MIEFRTLLLAGLVVLLSSCSAFYSASVTEGEALFERHRDAYQAVADAVIAEPRPRRYLRDHPLFDDIRPKPRFRYASAYPADGSPPTAAYINLYAYGLSISGRTVSLLYLREGEPEGEGFHTRVFETCAEAEAAFETGNNRLRLAYCALGDGWYAVRESS